MESVESMFNLALQHPCCDVDFPSATRFEELRTRHSILAPACKESLALVLLAQPCEIREIRGFLLTRLLASAFYVDLHMS
jgi:hypothetical protein